MAWFSSKLPLAEVPDLPPSPHRYVVVDVETTGLHAAAHRVISVAAIALDERGRPERDVVSFVDPGCHPGPAHIHGITPEMLRGQPSFAALSSSLASILEGRVMVAHNASFDFGFLSTEAARATTALPIESRLCTLALSRRLGLDVPNHQLGTLAGHWRVPQRRAHDAHDDALVLASIFAHSASLAARLDMPLPIISCTDARGKAAFPSRVVRQPCSWTNPGRLHVEAPLVQGMRVVVTGETREDRDRLAERLNAAGLDVMNSVSRFTSLLVCNDPTSQSGKTRRAHDEGVRAIDEATLQRLLLDVRPGTPKDTVRRVVTVERPLVIPSARQAPGPMARRRVLVMGEPHQVAAQVRAEVIARGGMAAVNLSANVTDIVLLDGADGDRRLARAHAAGIPVHRSTESLGIAMPGRTGPPATLTFDVAEPVRVPGSAVIAPGPVLVRGAVMDLPPGSVWTVNAAWRADAREDAPEVDVVAFLVDSDQRVTCDEDFVFYNAPIGPDGAVSLSINGGSEQGIRIDLDLMPEDCTRVVIAAVLDATHNFGDLGAISLSVDGDLTTAATATLDAATTERTLILAEIYHRNGAWRIRVVGQGYDDGLAELVTRYGVVVKD